MIKLTYEQKQYEYQNVGCQPYDMKTVMELKEDANIEEAIAMFMNFLKIVGYKIKKDTIVDALDEYFLSDYYR
jgi:hypothetical protein